MESLTPAKTLTLGAIAVPDEYFADFFRGCIDGDGTILVYTDRYHVPKNERYVYERLYVSLFSASPSFIDWVQATMQRLLGVSGATHVRRKADRRPLYVIRYAKHESLRIARAIYHSPDVPCLVRKRVKAERFAFESFARYSFRRGRGGTADSWRSKRHARKGVGVQIPSPPPTSCLDRDDAAPVP